MRREPPLSARIHPRVPALVMVTCIVLTSQSLEAQWDAPVLPHRTPLEWGEVIFDATLLFRSADTWMGGGPLADGLRRNDALDLFDTEGALRSALSTLGADPSTLRAGGTAAAVQASQTHLPLTVRAGLPWGLEVEATVRFVRTRLEADSRLLPAAGATLGRSPALDNPSAVQGFVDEVRAATQGFTAGGRDWEAWGAAWTAAYRASPLFPTAGSAAASQLLAELDGLNAALADAGRNVVAASPLFAAAALTPGEHLGITTGAPFGLIPFENAPFEWSTGDADLILRYGAFGDARQDRAPGDSIGRGIVLTGGVRIPLADQENPDLPFATAAGNGVAAALLGGEGWIEGEKWAATGSLRTTLHGSTDVVRRIAPRDVVFIGRDSRTDLSWTPGMQLLGQLRLEFTPAGPLRLSLGYTLDHRGEDSFERLGPVPEFSENFAFPAPPFFSDPDILEEGTGGTVHWVRGGARWSPGKDGGFGISFDVGTPVSGEIPRALEWTEIRFRAHRAVSLSGIF
ncbi:MAG: hypothetical protein RQ745_02640 [Longimicrobiales bacterium]|nr:hypothetical protein [Longimicrobiales bacterium]